MRVVALGPHHSKIHPLITNHTTLTQEVTSLRNWTKNLLMDKGQNQRQVESQVVFACLMWFFFSLSEIICTIYVFCSINNPVPVFGCWKIFLFFYFLLQPSFNYHIAKSVSQNNISIRLQFNTVIQKELIAFECVLSELRWKIKCQYK